MAPINHFWTGPSGFVSNSSNLTNLCVGTYCDSIVDANGCNVVKWCCRFEPHVVLRLKLQISSVMMIMVVLRVTKTNNVLFYGQTQWRYLEFRYICLNF